MKGSDAGRQRCEILHPPALVDLEDGAGSIPDKERPVARECQPAGHAEMVREQLRRAVGRHSIHRSFEPARDVQAIFLIDRHRRRVDDAGRERLARAVRTHPEDGHRHLLPAGAAVRHVQVVLAIENRIVDLVQSCRERRGDLDGPPRFVGDAGHAHRGTAALETGRHNRRQPRRRGVDETGRQLAYADLGKRRTVDGESCAFDGDAPAFNRAQRMNGGDARGH